MKLNTVNIIAFLLIISLIISTIRINLTDMKRLNKEYKNLENNSECIDFLRAVNAFPIWRLSLYVGILTSIISSFYLYLLINSKGLKPYLIYLFFWFSIILNWLIIYKTIIHWNWHYVTNDGGLKNGFYTNE